MIRLPALVLLLAACPGRPAATPQLEIADAVVRLAPDVGVGYLRIRNRGGADDRLLAIETAVAGETELHATTLEAGLARMEPHADGFAVPARADLVLESGGNHLMLYELAQPQPAVGSTVELRLRFEKAGVVRTRATIRPIID